MVAKGRHGNQLQQFKRQTQTTIRPRNPTTLGNSKTAWGYSSAHAAAEVTSSRPQGEGFHPDWNVRCQTRHEHRQPCTGGSPRLGRPQTSSLPVTRWSGRAGYVLRLLEFCQARRSDFVRIPVIERTSPAFHRCAVPTFMEISLPL